MKAALTLGLGALGLSVPVAARAADDPLLSPMWEAHSAALFGDDPVIFDPRVRVTFPPIAENQRVFPVRVDARGVGTVKRMVLLADLNPIPIAIDYRPSAAEPYFETRIKLDQRTPVRGAVQLADGSWHVWGGWIDAAGGGCSAPPVSRVKGDWAEHLGEIRGSAWPAEDGRSARLRMTIRHPMDTGYVENISAYHIEELRLADVGGRELGEMTVFASVAEDPAFTLMPLVRAGEHISIVARDTNGRDYEARVTVPRVD